MEQPNNNYINQLSGDDLEFKAKMIAILKRELPEEILIYQNQMINNDLSEAAQSVHKLKHKISILGLEKNYYIAEEFEGNLKNKNTKSQSDFEAILKVMQEFIEKL
ncbi:Hpt domain-containing protein [Flavobacterium hiemivividum]|uniref:Hpt domain-containing protein n=1 Tax=Flavobacterium hiemivividum TaxID=2541734 RepID=A0A4R5CVW4_9FLAO|nr:Hpt domain-containing protein [Flavobacterium hiemivividum]TDE03610.1 Hpt domain-containing protein [Flavobacterium hiemivividum]